MIELSFLGPIVISSPASVDADAVLAQPKRLALLAYLALGGPRDHHRDALVGLLWPESDQRRARDSLRQALRYLRQALGPDAIQSRGKDWVGLNHDRLRCDAWEFDRLLSQRQAAEALALYRGEALAGFLLPGAPEFDRWLDEVRRRYQGRTVEASWGLAESARDNAEAEAAVRWARRATALAPEAEDGIRRRIGIEVWAGNRSEALRAYEQFRVHIRELGLEPSRKTVELADRLLATATLQTLPHPKPELSPSATRLTVPAGPPPAPVRTIKVDPAGETSAMPVPSRLRRRNAVAVVLGVIGFAAAVALAFLGRFRAADADPVPPAVESIAVLPFRVGGAGAELAYLREGMVDLMSAAVEAGAGARLRVLSPHSVLRALGEVDSAGTSFEAQLEVAGDLRADWVIAGDVVGTGERVVLSAALYPVAGGDEVIRASTEGPPDSVYALAHRLAARLVALRSGEPSSRIPDLAAIPLPVLRLYLDAQAAYRTGRYEMADERYARALRMDSTFAPAALGLVKTRLSAPWLRGEVHRTVLPLAWRLRDRLGPVDRLFLTAVAGPDYPFLSPWSAMLNAWQQALVVAPEQPEIWYHWGDALLHMGRHAGIPNYRQQAAAAFDRALELDSKYALPLAHRIELAAHGGDTARVRRLGQKLFRGVPEGENADYLRWRIAHALGDSTALRSLRSRERYFSVGSRAAVLKMAQLEAVGIGDAERLAQHLPAVGLLPSERWTLLYHSYNLALNQGRPVRAARIGDLIGSAEKTPHATMYMAIMAALVGSGNRSTAAAAAEQLSLVLYRPIERRSEAQRTHYADLCLVELWRLEHGVTETTRGSIAKLRSPALPGDSTDAATERQNCGILLDVLLSSRERSSSLAHNLEALGEVLDQGGQFPPEANEAAPLLFARMLEENGKTRRALEVLRRRRDVPNWLADYLRAQARLAAQHGYTREALDSYEHYLALRTAPEPALRAQVDSVRQEYGKLRTGAGAW